LIYGNFITEDPRGNNSVFGEMQEIPMGYYELMREAFLARGIELNTPDLNKDKSVAFNLVIEGQLYSDDAQFKYLIAVENPHHNKFNASLDYCRHFHKVFTWNPHLDAAGNVVRVLSPHQTAKREFLPFDQRETFCCLINANKSFREKIASDLYPERVRVIRWYERHAPQYFALYGRGWDRPAPAYNFFGKVFRSIPSMRFKLFGHKHFPSYIGEIADKGEILRHAKFSYCYENNRDITNYITEKIIDSFVYGCVPVYWGANNIGEYIPEDCFIDRRKFRDTKDVHQFLLSITPEEFANYQSNIANFLQSQNAKKFSFEYFVSKIVSEISKDIGG